MALVPELLSPRGSLPLPMESCEWPVIRGAAVVRLKREVFGVLQEPLALTEVRQTGNWIATNEPTSPRRLTWRGTMSGMDIWLDFWCHQNDGNKVLLCWCDDSELSRSIHTRLWMGESKASVIFVEGRTGGWNGASSAMQHDILRGGALVGVSPTLLILQEMAPIIAFLRALPELQGYDFYLYGKGDAGAAAIYQAVLDESIAGVITEEQPRTHREGAYIPGILRLMDLDQAAGLLAPRPLAQINPGYCRANWAQRCYQRLGVSHKRAIVGSMVQAITTVLG